jgi:hypothetical protein
MRSACCLLAFVFAPAAPAREKALLQRLHGTIVTVTQPKGSDPGGMVLRTVRNIQRNKNEKVQRVVKEYVLVFAPHLRDGKLPPLGARIQKQYPHLPKHMKAGARVDVGVDLKPDKSGRYKVHGLLLSPAAGEVAAGKWPKPED